MSKKKRRTKLKPWAFWTLIFFFIILIFYSAPGLLRWNKDNIKIQSLEDKIQNMVHSEFKQEEATLINPPENDNNTTTENKSYDYWYYANKPFYSINFTQLLQENKDTVAFIHINNTSVNYPVVQTDNNEYYLTHAFDHSYNNAGWIFMDYRNKLENLDNNTIIYGHGRKNNTMFGSLKKLLTKEWQSNPDNFIINISSIEKNYLYQIFSIYTIEEESYYLTTNFINDDAKKSWINTMISRNTAININTTINENDKILTLSTCYDDNGVRIVVHAKLIKSSN